MLTNSSIHFHKSTTPSTLSFPYIHFLHIISSTPLHFCHLVSTPSTPLTSLSTSSNPPLTSLSIHLLLSHFLTSTFYMLPLSFLSHFLPLPIHPFHSPHFPIHILSFHSTTFHNHTSSIHPPLPLLFALHEPSQNSYPLSSTLSSTSTSPLTLSLTHLSSNPHTSTEKPKNAECPPIHFIHSAL